MHCKAKRELQFRSTLGTSMWMDLKLGLSWILDSEFSTPEFKQQSAKSDASEHCRWFLQWYDSELAFDFLVDTWADSEHAPVLSSEAQTRGLSTLHSDIPWRIPKTRAVWFRREWTYTLGKVLHTRIKLNVHAQGNATLQVMPALSSDLAMTFAWTGIHTAQAAVRLDTLIRSSELPSKTFCQDSWYSHDGTSKRSFLNF